jgi:hypothetical protein
MDTDYTDAKPLTDTQLNYVEAAAKNLLGTRSEYAGALILRMVAELRRTREAGAIMSSCLDGTPQGRQALVQAATLAMLKYDNRMTKDWSNIRMGVQRRIGEVRVAELDEALLSLRDLGLADKNEIGWYAVEEVKGNVGKGL